MKAPAVATKAGDEAGEKEKGDFSMGGDGILRSTTESPMSPTIQTSKKRPTFGTQAGRKKKKTFYEVICEKCTQSFICFRWEANVFVGHVDEED